MKNLSCSWVRVKVALRVPGKHDKTNITTDLKVAID